MALDSRSDLAIGPWVGKHEITQQQCACGRSQQGINQLLPAAEAPAFFANRSFGIHRLFFKLGLGGRSDQRGFSCRFFSLSCFTEGEADDQAFVE